MIAVAERINGMFLDVKKAIKNKEIILPSKGRFELVTPYWKQFE